MLSASWKESINKTDLLIFIVALIAWHKVQKSGFSMLFGPFDWHWWVRLFVHFLGLFKGAMKIKWDFQTQLLQHAFIHFSVSAGSAADNSELGSSMMKWTLSDYMHAQTNTPEKSHTHFCECKAFSDWRSKWQVTFCCLFHGCSKSSGSETFDRGVGLNN